ncbi:MAG: DUF4270 family protein [Bacteroidetes bacterium]|nr:DUF4270 family protein [Bacteroidota bacterium]
MARNRQFRQSSILFLLPVMVIILISGCQKPTINFGTSFINNNTTNVVVVDTFRVALSTVLSDSFATAGTGVSLLGRYKDPYFGTITSKAVLQIAPPASLPTISNLATYDSMSLILQINKTFYGDTTKVQRYQVSQLQSVIQLPENQFTFYNNSKFPFNPVPLGVADVQINPTQFVTSQKINDTIKIRLSDVLGKELFRMLYNHSDTVKNLSTFLGYFKGLTVYPDDLSEGSIYGFKDTVRMRIYYHEPGLVYTTLYSDFILNNKSSQFNQITFDRSGTPSSQIDSLHPEVKSTSTENIAFIQGATGLQVKALFPTIGALLQYPDYLNVLKAELTIKPIEGSYSPTFPLAPQLQLALTDQGNLVGSPLPFGTGSLVVDYLSGANTSYVYDITPYIKQTITAGAINNQEKGLMIYIPTPAANTTFNRTIIGDQFNSKPVNQIKLKIYYASFY